MHTLFATGRFIILSSLAVFGGLGAFLYWYSQPATLGPSGKPIVVYCADALRMPLETIAADFEKETDQKVELRVGASQTLLAQMELSQSGDLYLPADDSFL